MNKKILISALLASLFSPMMATANDKVATIYHPQGFQKVCQGKQQSDWDSLLTVALFGMAAANHNFLAQKKMPLFTVMNPSY